MGVVQNRPHFDGVLFFPAGFDPPILMVSESISLWVACWRGLIASNKSASWGGGGLDFAISIVSVH